MTAPDFTDASCIEDPELWFSTDPRDVNLAKAICRGCPLLTVCRDWTLTVEGQSSRHGRYGIAAGMTPTERARVRPPKVPAPHGTPTAYRRHYADGTPACAACVEANAVVRRARKAQVAA